MPITGKYAPFGWLFQRKWEKFKCLVVSTPLFDPHGYMFLSFPGRSGLAGVSQ